MYFLGEGQLRSECWTLTKNARTAEYNMKVIRMIQGAARWDRKRNEDIYRQSSVLPIVQVINENKLRLFGHIMRREEQSMLTVVMMLKMKGKRRARRWRDNIDRHLKGQNTSPKDVLETKCFENRQDWRKFISRSTDRSSEVEKNTKQSSSSFINLKQPLCPVVG